MAIPRIEEQNILEAFKYIDEHGIPDHNKSLQYELVTLDGKKYPLKYVIGVADFLANGKSEITTDGFNADEAKNYFEARGYQIATKQVEYELTITADAIKSTDDRFDLHDLGLGDNYRPLDAYFKFADGRMERRKYNKGEQRITNQTLPRLAFQIFESQISGLSDMEKRNFPICQYLPTTPLITGIYYTVEEFKKNIKKSLEFVIYSREGGPRFVIYSWNLFSTLIFAQECLRRFGNAGDSFVLSYRDKTEQEGNKSKIQKEEVSTEKKPEDEVLEGCRNPYSDIVLTSKNVIFRGAPGTGKSYLAKEIAADIISNGYIDNYTDLTDEQKKQVEFVQFHPSYDYSDFVEGLRPKMNEDGSMGFELQDGIFKRFVDKARRNFEDSQKSKAIVEQEFSAKVAMTEFFENISLGEDTFKTIKGNKFTITNVEDKYIEISIPGNATVDKLRLNMEELRRMLESGVTFEKISDVTNFFGKQFATQAYSYDFALYKAIKAQNAGKTKLSVVPKKMKNYIFIIDEINRGEISKILGELFFAIDPGYRGKAGEVATQYSNMHTDPNEKFYIPENVYIIGTMNDIDRSVDSFDFAMRRRFRFVEIRAEDTQSMLDDKLGDGELKSEAINRMNRLNDAIIKVPDLNENYQVGASYFRNAKELGFDKLWTDYLYPLLQDYVRGMYDEEKILKDFARAYGYEKQSEGDADEAAYN